MVYRGKTWSSDFQRHFGRAIFYQPESFAENETNGSQTVQGPGYTVGASKLPNQVHSSQRFTDGNSVNQISLR